MSSTDEAPAMLEKDDKSLSSDQRKVLNLVATGENIFLTGDAGTGKSFLIEQVESLCAENEKKIAITASTGMAAININGTTIHAFAGIGIAEDDIDTILQRVKKSKFVKAIWMDLELLIWDEISMAKPDYFAKLNRVAQVIRKSKLPFGGVQLLIVGDFCQLPPVFKYNEPVVFCFELPEWKDANLIHCQLNHVFRQSDEQLVQVLRRARVGETTAEDIAVLQSRVNAVLDTSDGIEPTVLYARLEDVDHVNRTRLAVLNTESRTYESKVGYAKVTAAVKASKASTNTTFIPMEFISEDQKRLENLHNLIKPLEQCRAAEKSLELKIGAQVLLTVNLSIRDKLVNGSRGVVTGFTERSEGLNSFPIVRFANQTVTIRPYMWKRYIRSADVIAKKKLNSEKYENNYIFLTQIPLRIAYALSIHRVQGLSLDKVSASLNRKVFADGMGYTCLSRVRSLNGLSLIEFDPACLRANPKVINFYKTLSSTGTM